MPGQPDMHASAGSLIEFPRVPFDLEIAEEFTKVSFIYHSDGLKMECEPF